MKDLEDLAHSVCQKLELKYDAESVKYLEGFIERTKDQIPKEQWQGLINSCAAFLGQCIIENYGGQWERVENEYIAISFDEQNKAFPFAKVNKQFEHGLEDSVYAFFTAIPQIMDIPAKKKKVVADLVSVYP